MLLPGTAQVARDIPRFIATEAWRARQPSESFRITSAILDPSRAADEGDVVSAPRPWPHTTG
jgi:hypothetical protein